MNLSQYLKQQADLQRILGEPMGEGEAAIKENVLALIVEASEVLQETNWKPWKVTRHKLNRYDITNELVDIFKFYLNIINVLGITEEEFDTVWDEKDETVKRRFKDGY